MRSYKISIDIEARAIFIQAKRGNDWNVFLLQERLDQGWVYSLDITYEAQVWVGNACLNHAAISVTQPVLEFSRNVQFLQPGINVWSAAVNQHRARSQAAQPDDVL